MTKKEEDKKLDEILEKNLPEDESPKEEAIEETTDDSQEDPTEEVVEEDTSASEEAEQVVESVKETQEGQEIAPIAVDMPNSWKKDYTEKWGTLPEDIKKYITEREHQSDVLSSRNGNLQKEVEGFNESLRPISAYLDGKTQQTGQTKGQYLANLVGVEQELEMNPDAMYLQLMQMYPPKNPMGLISSTQRAFNINNEQLNNQNPNENRLNQLLIQKDAELMKMQQSNKQTEHEQSLASDREVLDAYNNFMLNNPNFQEDQKPLLASYAEAVEQQNPDLDVADVLQEAYKRMTFSSEPNKADLKQEAVKEYKQEQAVKLKKSKEASASIGSSAPNEPVSKKRDYTSRKAENRSVDDILDRNFG